MHQCNSNTTADLQLFLTHIRLSITRITVRVSQQEYKPKTWVGGMSSNNGRDGLQEVQRDR